MASHRFHPDVEDPYNDPRDAILFDECDRCDEHAEKLFDLDHHQIMRLWNRMIAVEIDDTEAYRTDNEKKACNRLWLTYLLVERYGRVNPRELFISEEEIEQLRKDVFECKPEDIDESAGLAERVEELEREVSDLERYGPHDED